MSRKYAGPLEFATIEFEMPYLETGVFFTVRIRYTERNWWAVMGLRRARNIKLV